MSAGPSGIARRVRAASVGEATYEHSAPSTQEWDGRARRLAYLRSAKRLRDLIPICWGVLDRSRGWRPKACHRR